MVQGFQDVDLLSDRILIRSDLETSHFAHDLDRMPGSGRHGQPFIDYTETTTAKATNEAVS